MKQVHVMDESKKGSHVQIRASYVASLFLLTMVLLTTLVMKSALGDGVTLETDKPSYTVGEAVVFSGSGYSPGVSYGINISYVEPVEPLLVESLEFSPTDSALPMGVSWAIPFDAENGTYLAEAFDASVPETVLASARFQVLNATEALK